MALTVIAVVALAGVVTVTPARADGDLASAYALSRNVFVPFDAKIASMLSQQLAGLTLDAKRKRYRIKVALIATRMTSARPGLSGASRSSRAFPRPGAFIRLPRPAPNRDAQRLRHRSRPAPDREGETSALAAIGRGGRKRHRGIGDHGREAAREGGWSHARIHGRFCAAAICSRVCNRVNGYDSNARRCRHCPYLSGSQLSRYRVETRSGKRP